MIERSTHGGRGDGRGDRLSEDAAGGQTAASVWARDERQGARGESTKRGRGRRRGRGHGLPWVAAAGGGGEERRRE